MNDPLPVPATHFIEVYVLYGLAFMALAIAVFLQPSRDRSLPYAGKLWLLGLFGLFHGAKEWVDAWTMLYRSPETSASWFDASLLLVSFLWLFEFGRRLLLDPNSRVPARACAWKRRLGVGIYVPLGAGVVGLAGFAEDPIRGFEAGACYFFGLTGALSSGVMLWTHKDARDWAVSPAAGYYLRVAGAALIVYSLYAGFIVAGDPAFPVWLPTLETFYERGGVAVHVVRLICVFVLAAALLLIVREANAAARKREEAASAEAAELNASLARRVRESTASLEETNDRLRREIEERKRIEQELRHREATLKRAQTVGHIGSWDMDLRGNRLAWSAETYRIFDLPNGTPLTYQDFLERLAHPDDRTLVECAWRGTLKGIPYDIEHRIMVSGQVKWVRAKAEFEFDADGRAVAGIGIVQDITGRKQAEEEVRRTQDLLQLVVDSIPAYLSLVDTEQRFVLVNRAYEDWFQRSRDEIVGKPMADVLDAAMYPRVGPHVEAALAGETVHYELLAGNVQGFRRWWDIQYLPRFGPEGGVLGFFGLIFDITERKQSEARFHRAVQQLRASEQRQRELAALAQREQSRMGALLSAMSIGILFEDREHRIEYVNPAFLRMWEIEADFDPVGRYTREVMAHSAHRFAQPEAASRSVLRLADDGETGESFELDLHDGTILTQIAYPVADAEGHPIGRLWLYEDITRERQTAQQLLYLAERDPLTGLYNRHRFQEQLERLIAASLRNGVQFALIYFDLDEFKHINDTYGHKAGDTVLVRIAGEIGTLIRGTDMFARLGGDEFAILSTLLPSDDRHALPARIINAIASVPFCFRGTAQRITGSVGVALFPEHGDNAEDLVAQADTAMYQAKSQGKNAWAIYNPEREVSETMRRRLSWNRRIAEALEREAFELHFQGIYEVAGGALSHLEVLVRMHDPANPEALIMPGQFVPAAEKSGQITAIDRFVLSRTIQLLGRKPDIPPLAVNISGRTFDDPTLPQFIRSELARHGADPRRLMIELTETAAVSDIQDAQRFIEAIHRAGCRVCLDDFGSGFSTFGYMKYLGVEILKIDGLFIHDLPNNRDNQIFVKAMVDVARGLHKITVAEFVEDAATLAMVRDLGVSLAQGYYLDRPSADHPAVRGERSEAGAFTALGVRST